ncbi:MAG: helix-hairpin-helix domain-containing protein [Saprospiraceae bacterium]|nr:helix-hairpin-helix domain-containing protein [Saprospiraceae bacterium]
MKNFLHEYFYYTRSERNGALVLSILCVLLFVVPAFFPYIAPKPKSPDFEVLFSSEKAAIADDHSSEEIEITLFEFDPNTASKEELELLGLSAKLAQTIVNYRNKGGKFYQTEDLQKIYTLKAEDYERLAPYVRIGGKNFPKAESKGYSKDRPIAQLFEFDPNTASASDFEKLGLSDKTAATIVKYREKGGKFQKPEDLKKIYGIKETDYERLKPFIVLTPAIEMKTNIASTTPVKSPDFPNRATKPLAIDINQASPEEWQQLRGIGMAFAKRITTFRDKLGGFSSIEQVAETYGLPDSTFQQIKPQLKSSPIFRTIAINTASVEELKAHPYIDARLAAAIVSYREQHGAFSSVGDVARLKALPPTTLEKLKPYLSFD